MTKGAPGIGGSVLAQPLALRCGLVLPNRIMKAAMGEGLASASTSDVTPALIRLYERRADSSSDCRTSISATGTPPPRRPASSGRSAAQVPRGEVRRRHRAAL